jgi:putative peptide modification system cyclase
MAEATTADAHDELTGSKGRMVADGREAALASGASLAENGWPAPAQPGFAGDPGMTSDGHPAGLAGTGERAPAPELRALLLCDLAPAVLEVDSDEACGVSLLREHDRLVRELLAAHGGFEADKTNGFLALFERPIQAVAFALDYQRRLRTLTDARGRPLAGRVGIHVGDVVTWNNSSEDVRQGARRVEVEGLAKPVAARLMHLARPGQVLLSSIALALAQRAESELGEVAARVRWLGHGPYRFKGVPAPMEVHEVGEPGIAPLTPPPSDEKALRETPWWRRPAAIAAEMAAVLAVAVALFMLSGRPQPAIAFVERDWVVVGDLRNLTPDPGLTEALEVAFRISLEQSRHVNVLSDLKVRDTLRRMQRSPDAPLDRETGAEIALREGARALILPSVAEVGGRIRVSAEVIDPATLTTVYAESHDGIGIASTLRSMDKVSAALRARLGETLKAIASDSQPLPSVTTPSLDALRHYAHALSLLQNWRLGEAAEAFAHALTVDPEFALAHLGLGRVAVAAGRMSEARQHMLRAARLTDRLSPRDALHVDAWLASFGPLETLQDRWQLLTSLYPDDFAGHYNSGMFYRHHGADYARALVRVEPSTSSRNPFFASALQLKGSLLVSLDRLEEALAVFEESDLGGFVGLGGAHAMALAAAGRHDEAAARLARGSPTGDAGADLQRAILAAALLTDQGDIAAARVEFEQALAGLPEANRHDRIGLEATMLMFQLALGETTRAEASEALCEAAGASAGSHDLQDVWMVCLAGALAHAEVGRTAEAQRILALLEAQGRGGFPAIDALADVVRARILRTEGRPEDALRLLEAASLRSELFIVRAAAVSAAIAATQPARAAELAAALIRQRGRALGEYGNHRMLLPANVVHLNLLRLELAELALQQGDADAARNHLQGLLARWPATRDLPAVAARVARLEAELQASSL